MNLIYPPQDTSQFLTRSETGQFVTTGAFDFALSGASGILQSQINNFPIVNSANFVSKTGLNEIISGIKTFRTQLEVQAFNGEGYTLSLEGASGTYSQYGGAGPYLRLFDGTLRDESGNLSLNWRSRSLTGDWYTNTTSTNPNAVINLSRLLGASGALVSLIGASAAGVSTLNSLSGALNLMGVGSVSITTSGQTLIISGVVGSGGATTGFADFSGYITTGRADLRYYPLTTNPSGYITTGQTGQFASVINLAQTGSTLDNKINALSGWVSGAITGFGGNVSLSGYITTGNADARYYPLASNPSDYITNTAASGLFVRLNGADTIIGDKTLRNQIIMNDGVSTDTMTFNRVNINGVYQGRTGQGGLIDFKDLNIVGYNSTLKLSWDNNMLTGGAWNVQDHAGQLSNIINLRSLISTSGSLINSISGASGYLAGLVAASSAGVNSINGASGIITLTGVNGIFVTTVGSIVTVSGSGLFGALTSGFADARYYSQANPSGYISTGAADSRYYLITNPSGFIGTGITGQFASSINLTNTGVTLISYINGTTGAVKSINGLSGILFLTGAGTVTISANGNIITVSGGVNNAQRVDSNNIVLNPGSGSQFVSFTTPFSGTPYVIGNINYTGENSIVTWISGVTSGGFGLRFSDFIPNTGYTFTYLAFSGNVLSNGGVGASTPANMTLYSGSGTYLIPANARILLIEALGGGGGAGAGGNSATPSAINQGGGGGGGGGFASAMVPVSAITGLSLFVSGGQAGIGGSAGSQGQNGGDSFVKDGFFDLVFAFGGPAGGGGNSTSPLATNSSFQGGGAGQAANNSTSPTAPASQIAGGIGGFGGREQVGIQGWPATNGSQGGLVSRSQGFPGVTIVTANGTNGTGSNPFHTKGGGGGGAGAAGYQGGTGDWGGGGGGAGGGSNSALRGGPGGNGVVRITAIF